MDSTSRASLVLTGPEALLPSLSSAVRAATSEFDRIPEERKAELKKISHFIELKSAAGERVKVTFICTHNSRRSHFGQVWAQTAAAYYGVGNFKACSGGTEVTACNERTIAALGRAGFAIEDATGGSNPIYLIRYAENAEPVHSFSKVYNANVNPQSSYLAVMTCDQADTNCPLVLGASLRLGIHYEDPKVADGKPEEAAVYDDRCRQIARETFYAFSHVKK
jgi:protein-tyrosine phosphatase/arsenate reductase